MPAYVWIAFGVFFLCLVVGTVWAVVTGWEPGGEGYRLSTDDRGICGAGRAFGRLDVG